MKGWKCGDVKEQVLTEFSCLAAWEWEVQFQVVANSNLIKCCFICFATKSRTLTSQVGFVGTQCENFEHQTSSQALKLRYQKLYRLTLLTGVKCKYLKSSLLVTWLSTENVIVERNDAKRRTSILVPACWKTTDKDCLCSLPWVLHPHSPTTQRFLALALAGILRKFITRGSAMKIAFYDNQ